MYGAVYTNYSLQWPQSGWHQFAAPQKSTVLPGLRVKIAVSLVDAWARVSGLLYEYAAIEHCA